MSHEPHRAEPVVVAGGGSPAGRPPTAGVTGASRAAAARESGGGQEPSWPHLCEVLAAVPVQLGHHPAPGSVVAVGLTGPDQEQPRLVARIDAEILQGAHGQQVAKSVAVHLRSMECSRVLVALYEQCEARAGAIPASIRDVNGTVRLLDEACRACGIDWAGAWVLGPEQVRGYPDGPRFPRSDLAGSLTAVRARADGREPLAQREDLGQIPAAAHADRRAAAEGRLRWSQRRDPPGPGGFALAWGRWQQQSLLTWQNALTGIWPSPRATLGRIEAGLEDPLVVEACALALLGAGTGTVSAPGGPRAALARDDLIASICAPSLTIPLCLQGTDPGPPGSGTDVHLRPWLAGLLAPGASCPDLGRVRDAERLLRGVVSHGRRNRQSGALTLLGLLAWWRGDGVRSAVLVERALAQRRVEPLAAQLDWLLSAGAVTGWARASSGTGSAGE